MSARIGALGEPLMIRRGAGSHPQKERERKRRRKRKERGHPTIGKKEDIQRLGRRKRKKEDIQRLRRERGDRNGMPCISRHSMC
jgi:hypothetical protein